LLFAFLTLDFDAAAVTVGAASFIPFGKVDTASLCIR
jgi:hypothetical protein